MWSFSKSKIKPNSTVWNSFPKKPAQNNKTANTVDKLNRTCGVPMETELLD